MTKENLETIYAKLLDFASYKPRSEREVLTKIFTLCKRYPPDGEIASNEVTELLLSRLREIKLVSDQNIKLYLDGFVNSSKPRSPRSIESFLIRKGFDSVDVTKEISNISNEVWVEFAKVEAKRKLRFVNDKKNIKWALRKYLLSKGYTHSVVESAFDTMEGVK